MIALANLVSYDFFPINFVGFIFFLWWNSKTLPNVSENRRVRVPKSSPRALRTLGDLEGIQSSLSYGGLEDNEGNSPYHKGIKTMSFWQINASKNTWTPNYDCFRDKYYVFHFEMCSSLICVYKESRSLLAVAALSMIIKNWPKIW